MNKFNIGDFVFVTNGAYQSYTPKCIVERIIPNANGSYSYDVKRIVRSIKVFSKVPESNLREWLKPPKYKVGDSVNLRQIKASNPLRIIDVVAATNGNPHNNHHYYNVISEGGQSKISGLKEEAFEVSIEDLVISETMLKSYLN